MIDMSVSWISPPIVATSHEKPPFSCIKKNPPKTAILISDLSTSMCGLRSRRYKCAASEIEGTSEGNICSKNWPAPVCASGRALRPRGGRTGSVHGSLFWMGPHSRTLHCKVIMAAAEKIYRLGADERTKPAAAWDPVAGFKIYISHRPRNPRRTCVGSEDYSSRLSR